MSRISSFRTYFHAHICNSLRSSAPPSIKAKPKKKAAVLGVRPFGSIPTRVLAGQRLGVELALLEGFVQRRIHEGIEHPLHARRLLLASSGKVLHCKTYMGGTSLSEELLRKQDFLSERSVTQQGINSTEPSRLRGRTASLPPPMSPSSWQTRSRKAS